MLLPATECKFLHFEISGKLTLLNTLGLSDCFYRWTELLLVGVWIDKNFMGAVFRVGTEEQFCRPFCTLYGGAFPFLISVITMFFVGVNAHPGKAAVSALILLAVILLGVFMTFWVSRLLSGTLLKGVPSSFALELPPYRRPQIGKVITRSILDRTLFVLGRAVVVAAPAGLVIWLCANLQLGGVSLLTQCTGFLDPFARLLGMDGVILMAFLLGFPANEIVMPIIIMAYLSTGQLTELGDLAALHTLLTDNGWTWLTAVCTMLFSLMHWPCSTTCMTIAKETGSAKWTFLSFALPTAVGMVVCFLVATMARTLGLG